MTVPTARPPDRPTDRPGRPEVDEENEVSTVMTADVDEPPPELPRTSPREAVGFDAVTVELGDSPPGGKLT